MLNSDNLSVKSIENCWIEDDELTTLEIENAIPQALLFQSGYLTIGKEEQEESMPRYFLKIPNFEVRRGMYFKLLHLIIGGRSEDLQKEGKAMLACIAQHKFVEFKEKFAAFLADVPHQISKDAAYERYYHLILYSMFSAIGAKYTSEKPSNKGESDIVLFYANQVFVVELKMLRPGQKVETALKGAIQQIKDRLYADPHKGLKKPINLVGMVFSKEKHNIVGILHEELDDDA